MKVYAWITTLIEVASRRRVGRNSAVCRVLSLLVVLAANAASSPASAEDLFAERVAPLLQRRCLSCHNGTDRKGDFSLETASDLRHGEWVDPANPLQSPLLDLITPDADGAASMPQDADPFTAEELTIIRRWLQQGAVWPEHVRLTEAVVADRDWWSLQPLRRPELPSVPASWRAWARTPVDVFVLRRMLDEGLEPAPEADRRTLIRRLYFDVVGLPPTPGEVAEFLSDPAPDAYERLVERLLASPHYGERWARHWLDVVHYADTHGYDKDKLREHAWPYRDYVIRSFNADKPYSRFVQEQVAGDVLFPASPDGVVAMGFLAAGPWDFIGHAEVPESKIDGQVARLLDRDDLVTTVIGTFNSLTVQCARCHHHKFDPITQEHYYSLQAVFASIDRADRPYDRDPAVTAERLALARRRDELSRRQTTIAEQVASQKTAELQALEARIDGLRAAREPDAQGPRSPAYGYHSQVASNPQTVKWVQVDLGRPQPIDTVILVGADEYGWADFGFPARYRIEASLHPDFQSAVSLEDRTQRDVERPGARPVVCRLSEPVQARYVRVTATRLWERRRRGEEGQRDWIFAMGELAVLRNGALLQAADVTALDSIEAAPRWSRENLIDGVYGRQALEDPAATLPALAEDAESRDRKLAALEQQLQTLEHSVYDPELLAERTRVAQELVAIAQRQNALPAPELVYAGTVHRGQGAFRGRAGLGPRTIHVLHRGDVRQPLEEARPGTIPLLNEQLATAKGFEFDLPSEHSEGQRRAALARWLTDRRHPLTWRSIVNRVWLYHFGRGIVDSPNDFGRMGQRPTHPELLDWLSCEFRDTGQSLKQLHRLLLNSSVYRQSSRVSTAAADADAGNRFYSHMSRRRLEAEALRDAVLQISGRLRDDMFGPGFRDFVIEKPQHSPHYKYDQFDANAPESHRRTVYRFLVRSQPQPFMESLDCADPSVRVGKRSETLTPLQALALLNNDFMLCMSRHFADRLERERDTLAGQIRRAVQLTTQREAASDEIQVLSDYAQRHGLANACRILLNTNEFVFVD